MYNLNGTRVILARLVTTYHIQGLGQVGPGALTEEGTAGRKLPLKLTYMDGGVVVRGASEGKKFQSFIPGGNIVGLDLDPSNPEDERKTNSYFSANKSK